MLISTRIWVICFFSDFSLRLDSLFQTIPLTNTFVSWFDSIFIRTQNFLLSFCKYIILCVLLFLFCSKNQNLLIKIIVLLEKKERKKTMKTEHGFVALIYDCGQDKITWNVIIFWSNDSLRNWCESEVLLGCCLFFKLTSVRIRFSVLFFLLRKFNKLCLFGFYSLILVKQLF